MKTIDILVEELPNRGGWPEKVTHIGQDYDSELMFYGRGNVRSGIFLDQLAVDHRKCGMVGTKITREQYEAALAAKNEGWIEWGGGECPVADFLKVEYQLRGGAKGSESAKILEWQHEGGRHDIIAYRLHKPNEAEQDKADLNECASQDVAPVWNGADLPPVGCFCEITDPDGMLVYGQGESGEVIAHVENTAVIRMSYGLGCFEAGFLRPLRTEAERKREAAIKELTSVICGEIPDIGMATAAMYAARAYDAIAAGKIPGVNLED